MGINIEIWVNKKEVLDKIKKFGFWELMYYLESLNGVRYYKLQEILNDEIRGLPKYSREDIRNKWVLKEGLINLERKKDFIKIGLLYIFKNLNEFVIVPDETIYENDELISVSTLIEDFESNIEL